MSIKALTVKPILKSYPAGFKTMESSLASYGYNRAPGTHVPFIPKREADGRYRTGLDKHALYIKKLSPEEQVAEIKTIELLLKELENVFGSGIEFANPRSAIWNAYGASDVKASPVKLGNGETVLNPAESVQDLINYCWIRVHPDIARSLESYNRGECPGCAYYVENSEAENRVLYARKREINKAIALFESLTPTKQKQVARLLGLPVTDDSFEEEVYNQIDTLLKKPEFSEGEFRSMSPVKKFTEIVKLTDEALYAKDLIEQALRHNIYRLDASKRVREGEMVIALNKQEFTEHLLDPANQKELLVLEKNIQAKRIASLA